MTRAQALPHAKVDRDPDAEPLDLLRYQLGWLDELISLQATWLTSCLALQANCWQTWAAGSQQLPVWMVWHNGTEQLA